GAVRERAELVALLTELLGQDDVHCDFSDAERFDPNALFAREGSDAEVRVFLRPVGDRQARLYFGGSGGERFLLRSVDLPSGLDEVGRELVGQVIETSVMTLLHSSSGLSREQASAAVASENPVAEVSPPPSRAPVGKSPSRAPANESEAKPHEPLALELALALRYAAEWTGSDFGLAHGPGLELAIGSRSGLRLRGRVSGEWFFEQSLDAKELTVGTQTSALRAGFEAGTSVADRQLVSLGVGGGVDIVRVAPGDPLVAGVEPAAPETAIRFVFRPELRYELDLTPVVLAFAVFADLSLARTHYDLAESGSPTELGAPWPVKPGAALMLGMVW
ncbi:MAG TPA: hypothetical protein VF103_06855, partial [Polyangiaceae bacterium]